MLQRLLHQRNRDRGGVAGEGDVGADDLFELIEQFLLRFEVFRNALDNEIAIGKFFNRFDRLIDCSPPTEHFRIGGVVFNKFSQK